MSGGALQLARRVAGPFTLRDGRPNWEVDAFSGRSPFRSAGLVALADFDFSRWEQLGYPSLFSFLRRELRLSAGAAQYRKTAAELVRRYPQVEEALRSGDLCLSSVVELGKVIAPENVAELLPRFFGLSSRDAAAVVASIRPVEDPIPTRAPAPARSWKSRSTSSSNATRRGAGS